MPEEIGRPLPSDIEGGMPPKKKKESSEYGSGEVAELYEGVEETKSFGEDEKEAEDETDANEKETKEAEELEVAEDEEYASIEVNEGEDEEDIKGTVRYKKKLLKSFNDLIKSPFLTEKSLRVLSPKFLEMLKNIKKADHIGLHLVYSQFRTMEGIGIFGEVLKANGFVQFKIEKKSAGWDIVTPIGVPCFALYSGTETKEEKEIIRKIFNGEWHTVGFPPLIFEKLKDYESNMFGEIIKVLMITASGSEGINLRNTRYVHIMEPYWHPARMEQVIGRARRICCSMAMCFSICACWCALRPRPWSK
jgi:SNF2 family DNA or RNA helicase